MMFQPCSCLFSLVFVSIEEHEKTFLVNIHLGVKTHFSWFARLSTLFEHNILVSFKSSNSKLGISEFLKYYLLCWWDFSTCYQFIKPTSSEKTLEIKTLLVNLVEKSHEVLWNNNFTLLLNYLITLSNYWWKNSGNL